MVYQVHHLEDKVRGTVAPIGQLSEVSDIGRIKKVAYISFLNQFFEVL